MARFLHCKTVIRDTQRNADTTYKNCRESRKAARRLRLEHGESEVRRVDTLGERPFLPVSLTKAAPPPSQHARERFRHVPARKAKGLTGVQR